MQNPVRINGYSEPEPDIAILAFREDYYTSTGVIPSDVLLLIEVSDTTGRHSVLRQDRNVKLPLYASANIAEVWIIDVGRKQLEIYRQPSEGRYQYLETLTREDTVSATQLPLQVQVKELIG